MLWWISTICLIKIMNKYYIDSPKALLEKHPLSTENSQKISKWREEIQAILAGNDPRLLLIVGPCSIHNKNAAYEYATLLKELSEQVKEHFFIVMRTYFEKARTQIGWKGLLYDPHLDSSDDIATGIVSARSLLIDLVELGLPTGCEFLDPLAANYISDLISWGSIGARTAQSQIHRQLASDLPMPVGFKNRTDGNIEVAIQSILAANRAHTFLSIGNEGQVCIKKSSGNIFPHLVLRGGEQNENFDKASITSAAKLLQTAKLPLGIIVDCSHDNSKKSCFRQGKIFSYLIHEKIAGLSALRGIMLESFLLEGTQSTLTSKVYSLEEIAYGASLTDPCLDWQATKALILEAHRLKSYKCQMVNL